jgi:hypothetical protein
MQQMEGGGLGIQWGCEQTFTGSEATDETTSSGTRYSKLKRRGWLANSVFWPSCIIIVTTPHLVPINPLHVVLLSTIQ